MIVTFLAAARSRAARRSPRSISRRVARATRPAYGACGSTASSDRRSQGTARTSTARESPGSGEDLSPGWRPAWISSRSPHGRQGTCRRFKGDTVTSPASGATAPDLPDYAPIPRSALGPALNEQGYYVGRVERNLYYVTDGVYQSAFLTTPDGVVLFDAPPSIGGNLQRAVDEIAAANGVTNTVTHLVYSHHHADHGGRVLAVRRGRGPDRARGDPAAAAAGRRPGPAAAGGDLRRPLHAGGGRRAGRAGLARPQSHAGQHLHPLPRPRHADVHRRGQRRLGADLQPQPVRGRHRVHGRPGHRAVLPVDALHLRAPRPARHPRGRRGAPAVHRRHRGQLAGRRWPRSTRCPTTWRAGRTSGPG